MPRKNGPVTARVESAGVRKRFGRPVMDATQPIIMPLTGKDIARAAKKRAGYGVDDPDNFSECVLATCISKAAGADVLIMRRHAYVLLPGAKHTLRFEVDPETTELIHLNDEGRFSEIPPNVSVKLRPPAPRRRLVAMRANAKSKGQYRESRGTERKQRPVDPYKGVYRHGNRTVDA